MELLFVRWAKLTLLSILTTIMIILFATITYQVIVLGWGPVLDWQGWGMVTGIAAVLSAIGIGLLTIHYLLHYYHNRSSVRVQFLISLGEHLNQSQQKYYDAWLVLKHYQEPPGSIAEEEWYKVVRALRKCYESTCLLQQIALLTKDNLLSVDYLHTFYYKDLTFKISDRLRLLLTWCDTGLELEAGYDIEEVKALLASLKDLFFQLQCRQQSLKGELVEDKSQEFREIETVLTEYENYLKNGATNNIPLNNNDFISSNESKEKAFLV